MSGAIPLHPHMPSWRGRRQILPLPHHPIIGRRIFRATDRVGSRTYTFMSLALKIISIGIEQCSDHR
jgi:hypothetical protein